MLTHSFLADQVPDIDRWPNPGCTRTLGYIRAKPDQCDFFFGHCQRPKLNVFNSVLAWKGTCRSVILGRREYDQSPSTFKRARGIAHHPSASKV
jgi:hypothetical protein